MKTYIDLGAGVAGDMLLGAMVGLGVPPEELSRALIRAIPIKGWRLKIEPTERSMWPAWSVRVQRDRPLTSTLKMLSIMQRAAVPDPVKRQSMKILKTLIAAEHAAHGHAHGRFDPRGLGRIDTLVDIIGNAWSAWRLGLAGMTASALNTGRIAPAARHMLTQKGVPIYSDSSVHELATPTGVAIITTLVDRFEPMPVRTVQKAGYGAGALERPGKPNVLAIYQGKTARKLLKYRT